MTLRWVAADLATGRVADDLPGLEVDYPFRHTLSASDTATGALWLDGSIPDWRELVRSGGTVVACYDDDAYKADTPPPIQWAAYVYNADPRAKDNKVTLSLSTLEGYLDRRYVRDVTYATADHGRNDIVAALVASFVNTAGGLPGVPLQVQVMPGASNPHPPDDIVWQNADNTTVMGRLTELIGNFGGEFTIRWAWSTDRLSLVPTLYIGDRVGQVVTAGLAPAVTLETWSDVSHPTDYSDGGGANVVTAYSSGQGDLAPYAPDAVATDFAGRPAFEYRYEPVSSEDDPKVLGQHAQQAISVLAPGAQPLSMSVPASSLVDGVALGRDWDLGDDVGYEVDECLAFPDGLSGVARVIAVEWTDPSTVTPIFAQPEVYVSTSTNGGL